MDMQLLAEKPQGKSVGRDTCSLLLQAGANNITFLEKHTLPPDCPFQNCLFQPPLAFAPRAFETPRDQRGKSNLSVQHSVPALATSSPLRFCLAHCSTQTIQSSDLPPRALNTALIFLLACLCFCHAPHLESPPCPLISADPTSIAEGRIQTLPFQRSPPPSSYTSCLYQLLGIVEVLLCSCVCVCVSVLPASEYPLSAATIMLPNKQSQHLPGTLLYCCRGWNHAAMSQGIQVASTSQEGFHPEPPQRTELCCILILAS